MRSRMASATRFFTDVSPRRPEMKAGDSMYTKCCDVEMADAIASAMLDCVCVGGRGDG
jgi:hypothetical protein